MPLRKDQLLKGIHRWLLICGALLSLAGVTSVLVEGTAQDPSTTIESAYPGLASGPLTYATLNELPDEIILRAGPIEITAKDVDGEMTKAPESVQEQLKENAFFVLEQIATKKLLLQAAREHADQVKASLSRKSEGAIIQAYLRQIVDKVEVTKAEVEDFYRNNRGLFGGATLEQIEGQLKQYMLQQKRQQAIIEHIRTLGHMVPIEISASWVKKQATLARDNPVDKARMSGRPSLVDFGATGCRPCDMMAPILAELGKKYKGRLNVLFVHVREEQILAARYGIQGIPVQVFFDKGGKEVFRHTGFFPQDEIEKKLKEMGVK